jgi:hypothetical protein
MPVLHVMPDPAMVNDVVEPDHRIVVGAEELPGLVIRPRRIEGRHEIPVDVGSSEGRG